jgi:hypothetical protein
MDTGQHPGGSGGGQLVAADLLIFIRMLIILMADFGYATKYIFPHLKKEFSNTKHYLINQLLSTILGGQYFCLSFPSIDRTTAPGQYEQFYLNIKTLTKMYLIPNNISFKEIRYNYSATPFVYSIRW